MIHSSGSFTNLQYIIYISYIDTWAPMTSIFEGQPPKTRPFPNKTRVIWVPGIYIYVYYIYYTYYTLSDVPDVPPLWSFPVMLAGRARPIYLLPSFRIPSLRLCQTSPSSQIKVSATSSSPVTIGVCCGTHCGRFSWS